MRKGLGFAVPLLAIILLVVMIAGGVSANGNDTHHFWDHMMDWDWWGIPYMGLMMIGIWLLFIVVAVVVYMDAEKRGMNGLLWFILVIIPWIGIISLIIYLIVREDVKDRNRPG